MTPSDKFLSPGEGLVTPSSRSVLSAIETLQTLHQTKDISINLHLTAGAVTRESDELITRNIPDPGPSVQSCPRATGRVRIMWTVLPSNEMESVPQLV